MWLLFKSLLEFSITTILLTAKYAMSNLLSFHIGDALDNQSSRKYTQVRPKSHLLETIFLLIPWRE